MPVTLLSQSWFCLTCGYHLPVAIDPFGPYYTEQFLVVFRGKEYYGVPAGMCPSCYAHPDPEQRALRPLEQATAMGAQEHLIKTTTLQQADLDDATQPAFDADGRPVMVDSGAVKQTLGIVDGKPAVIETPIMVQESRAYTVQEKQEALEQAERSLDTLSDVALKEVTIEPIVELDAVKPR